jgi:hypothetical protein
MNRATATISGTMRLASMGWGEWTIGREFCGGTVEPFAPQGKRIGVEIVSTQELVGGGGFVAPRLRS